MPKFINKIKEDIAIISQRDPAAKSKLEVIFCYPGFHALLFYRFSHAIWRRNFRFFARFISHLGRFFTGIEIHPAAKIGHRLFIDHGMGVVIGETASIGDDVTIYHGVTLGGTSWEDAIRHPQIGNNVIIGAGAQLLGPIKVGDNARIGSNAVVVKDVSEGATMVGIPARAVRSKEEKEHFDAYGLGSGAMPDPVARAIDGLMLEISQLRAKVAELEGNDTIGWRPHNVQPDDEAHQ
jgi:serine O-acetyltransferase